jgi:hypothetical protein
MSSKDWSQGSAHSEHVASDSASVGASSHPTRWDAHSQTSSTSTNGPQPGAAGSVRADVVGVSRDEAWDFTRALSLRSHVRGMTADGYSEFISCDGPPPTGVWAIYLTDARLRYRLLGFDFDAKGDTVEIAAIARTAAQHGADQLVSMLRECGIEYVVCESGPSGGRHVWVALATPLSAEYVSGLADVARTVFGRIAASGEWVLDIGMLSNRKTGLLRPPGAPHAAGGASTVITGDPAVLLPDARSTTRQQVDALLQLLQEAKAALPTGADTNDGGQPRSVTVDEAPDGHLWIPGTRRELAGPALAKVHAPIASDTDASDVLFSILCSCARAHWTFTDVHTRLAGLPGLEHARTRRSKHQPGTRERRPRKGSQSPKQILGADWRRAIAYLHDNSIAALEQAAPVDPDFARRAAAVCAETAAIRRHADLNMRRWTMRGGAADRRVLDALCEIADNVVQLTVGADVRTLAELAGVHRERSRNALHRLARDGWITLAAEHTGPRAAVWTLSTIPQPAEAPTTTPTVATEPAACTASEEPPLGHTGESTTGVSLGAIGPEEPRPLDHKLLPTEDGASRRRRHLAEAAFARELATHDCFTGSGHADLSTWDGLVYARIPSVPADLGTLMPGSTPPDWLASAVEALHSAGLIGIDRGGRVYRVHEAARESYAQWIGTAGTLDARKEQHRIERELWAWWLDEMTWMTAASATERRPGRRSGRRRPGQQSLDVGLDRWADRAPYPRRPGGRRDHRAARVSLTIETAKISP